MEDRYRIELLGGLQVWHRGRALDRFPTVKSALLLAYLARHQHRAPSRDELAGLFWPDSLPGRARPSLCQALWLLRRMLVGKDSSITLFLADRASVGLDPAHFRVDVTEFEAAVRAAEKGRDTGERRRLLVEALRIYRGELLAGYADTWLLPERVALAETYFTALRRLLTLLETAREPEEAVAWVREGLRQDPLREELHRDLIRLLAAAGEPEAALRQYRELTRLLKTGLDSSPSAATRTLVGGIQRRLARDPKPSARRSASQRMRAGRPSHGPRET